MHMQIYLGTIHMQMNTLCSNARPVYYAAIKNVQECKHRQTVLMKLELWGLKQPNWAMLPKASGFQLKLWVFCSNGAVVSSPLPPALWRSPQTLQPLLLCSSEALFWGSFMGGGWLIKHLSVNTYIRESEGLFDSGPRARGGMMRIPVASLLVHTGLHCNTGSYWFWCHIKYWFI